MIRELLESFHFISFLLKTNFESRDFLLDPLNLLSHPPHLFLYTPPHLSLVMSWGWVVVSVLLQLGSPKKTKKASKKEAFHFWHKPLQVLEKRGWGWGVSFVLLVEEREGEGKMTWKGINLGFFFLLLFFMKLHLIWRENVLDQLNRKKEKKKIKKNKKI